MQRVTAAVLRHNGRILIAKRRQGKHMGPKWEFPGGKIDPGESPEECLKRELAEEFSIEARIAGFICSVTHESKDIQLEIFAYHVEHVSGDFKLHEHDEIRWVLPGELESYDLVDSDRSLIRKIFNRE